MIQLIQHFPDTKDGQRELAKQAAATRVQIMLWYFEEIDLPIRERIRLLEAISAHSV